MREYFILSEAFQKLWFEEILETIKKISSSDIVLSSFLDNKIKELELNLWILVDKKSRLDAKIANPDLEIKCKEIEQIINNIETKLEEEYSEWTFEEQKGYLKDAEKEVVENKEKRQNNKIEMSQLADSIKFKKQIKKQIEKIQNLEKLKKEINYLKNSFIEILDSWISSEKIQNKITKKLNEKNIPLSNSLPKGERTTTEKKVRNSENKIEENSIFYSENLEEIKNFLKNNKNNKDLLDNFFEKNFLKLDNKIKLEICEFLIAENFDLNYVKKIFSKINILNIRNDELEKKRDNIYNKLNPEVYKKNREANKPKIKKINVIQKSNKIFKNELDNILNDFSWEINEEKIDEFIDVYKKNKNKVFILVSKKWYTNTIAFIHTFQIKKVLENFFSNEKNCNLFYEKLKKQSLIDKYVSYYYFMFTKNFEEAIKKWNTEWWFSWWIKLYSKVFQEKIQISEKDKILLLIYFNSRLNRLLEEKNKKHEKQKIRELKKLLNKKNVKKELTEFDLYFSILEKIWEYENKKNLKKILNNVRKNKLLEYKKREYEKKSLEKTEINLSQPSLKSKGRINSEKKLENYNKYLQWKLRGRWARKNLEQIITEINTELFIKLLEKDINNFYTKNADYFNLLVEKLEKNWVEDEIVEKKWKNFLDLLYESINKKKDCFIEKKQKVRKKIKKSDEEELEIKSITRENIESFWKSWLIVKWWKIKAKKEYQPTYKKAKVLNEKEKNKYEILLFLKEFYIKFLKNNNISKQQKNILKEKLRKQEYKNYFLEKLLENENQDYINFILEQFELETEEMKERRHKFDKTRYDKNIKKPDNKILSNINDKEVIEIYWTDWLVIKYQPAIKKIVSNFVKRTPVSVNFNDLYWIANEVLVKKSRTYDSLKNDNFWGFANIRVNWAILDYLISIDPVTRKIRKILKKLEHLEEKYSEEEAIKELEKEYSKTLISEALREKNSVIFNYSENWNDENYFWNIWFYDDREKTQKNLENEQYLEIVKNFLKIYKKENKFSERDLEIFEYNFFENKDELSQEELSKKYWISATRISQIIIKVTRKLKEDIKLYELNILKPNNKNMDINKKLNSNIADLLKPFNGESVNKTMLQRNLPEANSKYQELSEKFPDTNLTFYHLHFFNLQKEVFDKKEKLTEKEVLSLINHLKINDVLELFLEWKIWNSLKIKKDLFFKVEKEYIQINEKFFWLIKALYKDILSSYTRKNKFTNLIKNLKKLEWLDLGDAEWTIDLSKIEFNKLLEERADNIKEKTGDTVVKTAVKATKIVEKIEESKEKEPKNKEYDIEEEKKVYLTIWFRWPNSNKRLENFVENISNDDFIEVILWKDFVEDKPKVKNLQYYKIISKKIEDDELKNLIIEKKWQEYFDTLVESINQNKNLFYWKKIKSKVEKTIIEKVSEKPIPKLKEIYWWFEISPTWVNWEIVKAQNIEELEELLKNNKNLYKEQVELFYEKFIWFKEFTKAKFFIRSCLKWNSEDTIKSKDLLVFTLKNIIEDQNNNEFENIIDSIKNQIDSILKISINNDWLRKKIYNANSKENLRRLVINNTDLNESNFDLIYHRLMNFKDYSFILKLIESNENLWNEKLLLKTLDLLETLN